MWHFVIVCLTACIAQFKSVEAQTNYGYNQQSYRSVQDGTPKKVHLLVIYETNCPDSMRFVTEQLYPSYDDIKDIVDLQLVPFGKASESYDKVTDSYTFRCQHGPDECYGNTVASCAIAHYPNIRDHLNFIYCMESHPRPSSSGEKCARRVSMDWKKISKCADGAEGNKLLHEKAVITNSVDPRLTFVPWIIVDQVFTSSNLRRSLRDLKGLVCDAYKGNHSKCK